MAIDQIDCVFCKIIEGELPAKLVHEDDQVIAFKDIHPKAEVHLLLVPRTHIASLEQLEIKHERLVSHLLLLLPDLAHQQGLQDGFRTIINTGRGGGQEVDHLHIHLLGGSQLPGF
ncbi:histidine triad nucleotide-binding protein [Nitrosococcus watsonii]|uniref:Histidine triad (HIT) protein n=1 Tax=Nitrosococcus watsoni (strain C-113) TaxID=105559 RepID=D8K4M6_NITWC|nr:histidine triad nucleotide-binding protein [Nitrosococcus watsonii]ADJ29828.1 histidine triad (HIT) protein [Nitrosococcus watsonii C-113]